MRSPGTAPKALLAVALVTSLAAAAPLGQGWVPPPPEFSDVTRLSGIDLPVTQWEPSMGPAASLLDVLPPGSPAAGDFNQDGYPDLFVPMTRYTNDTFNALRPTQSRLYMNDGSTRELEGERFLDVTDVSGIDVRAHAYAAAWGDHDGDGYPDLLVVGYQLAKLYRNNQQGTFTDVTASRGIPQGGFPFAAAWGDYDLDGDLDLALGYLGLYTHPTDGLPALTALPGAPNRLLRNDGAAFTDVSAAAGLASVARRTTSLSWVDATGDGLVDLYATNYGQPAELWVNQGDGTFLERAAQAGIADGEGAACQAWEDLDRDGDLDLFVGHPDGVQDGAWRNLGGGSFAPLAAPGLESTAAGDGWACFAFDYDGDNDMDLFVGNAGLGGARQPAHLLESRAWDEGAVRFVPSLAEAGDNDQCGYTSHPTISIPRALGGAIPVDYDLYGTPDIVGTPGAGDQVRVYKNTQWVGMCGQGWPGESGSFMKVLLDGNASNRHGLGAVVTVSAGNVAMTRQVGAGASRGSQSLTETMFGLNEGDNEGYASDPLPFDITVRWPGGAVDTYLDRFFIDRFARFHEGEGFQRDVLAPRPSLAPVGGTQAGANGWYTSGTVSLRLTAIDARAGGSEFTLVKSMRYSTNGVSWTTIANPKVGATVTFSGEGLHRLWIDVQDDALLERPDGSTVSRPNRAVLLYPVRIDTGLPSAAPGQPDPLGVYVQGREVAQADAGTPEDRAIVLSPVPLGFQRLGAEGQALEGLLGSDGTQPVSALASDARSGVWKVDFELRRGNGALAASGTARLAPYVWHMDPGTVAAGEYKLTATARDVAGLAASYTVKVVVLPSGASGVEATQAQGPSPPTLG